MIDEGDTARLGDFGLLGVMTDSTDEFDALKLYDSNRVGYMAPELFIPRQFNLQNSNPTNESDVYSLAMTAYEARSLRTARDHRSSPTLILH